MIFWAAVPSTFAIQLQKKTKMAKKRTSDGRFFFRKFSNLSSIIKTKSKLIEWFGYKADFKKDSELSC
jgi:hypothetical protein